MRLEAAVLKRISGLAPDAAAAWIAEHGLLALARCDELPPPVLEALRPRLRANAARNLHLVERFRRVVDALEGIPVCPLKGIYLLDRIYRQDPESRVLGDLDLLVPEAALAEAMAALERTGFRESAGSRRLRHASAERELRDADGLLVELHTRLSFKHGIASTWNDVRPVPATVHGRDVFALDRETTLVHLVTHMVRHRPLSRLAWVEDLLRWQAQSFDSEPSFDPEQTLAVARRLGSHRTLIAGTRILRRALPHPDRPDRAAESDRADLLPGLPSSADWPAQAAILANEKLLWRDLEATIPSPPSEGSPLGRNLTALLLADSLADALAFARVKLRAKTARDRSHRLA